MNNQEGDNTAICDCRFCMRDVGVLTRVMCSIERTKTGIQQIQLRSKKLNSSGECTWQCANEHLLYHPKRSSCVEVKVL